MGCYLHLHFDELDSLLSFDLQLLLLHSYLFSVLISGCNLHELYVSTLSDLFLTHYPLDFFLLVLPKNSSQKLDILRFDVSSILQWRIFSLKMCG